MVIESLYDLGVIQKKKKKRRKKKNNKGKVAVQSVHATAQGTPVPQSPMFQNTSNLQNEYMREQLLSLENSNTQRPHIRELENQLENQRIFQNQTQRALLYLHNHSNPIIEEVGYESGDNIDVPSSGGSDAFVDEGVNEPVVYEPIKQSSIFSFFTPSKTKLPAQMSSAKTPQDFKNFAEQTYRELDDFDDNTPYNSDLEDEPPKQKTSFWGIAGRASGIINDGDEEEQPKPKRSYNAEREALIRTYINKGGEENILNTTSKRTVQGAMKRLDKKIADLNKLKEKYENVLGGDDESLINGNISVYDQLKSEVERMEGLVRKSKKGKK